MGMRSSIAVIATTLSTLASAGCTSELGSCPSVGGTFKAQYTKVSGDCRPAYAPGTPQEFCFQPLEVPFEGGESGINTEIVMRTNDVIETKIIMKGCEISMTQTVRVGADPRDIMDGTIDVWSAEQLGGLVTREEYAPDNSMVCRGVYEAVFTKSGRTLGAADF